MSRSAAETDQAFAGWLRRAMTERGVSQQQLAARSGVDHSTISRLLGGQRNPSLATAARLARALEVSLEPAGLSLPLTDLPGAGPPSCLAAALRSDPLLGDTDIDAILRLYIALRGGLRDKAGSGLVAPSAHPLPAQPRVGPEPVG